MNILYETPSSQYFSGISDYSFLQSIYHGETIYDGDDRYEDFLYAPYEMFGLYSINSIISEGVDPKIAFIKGAEASLIGDKNFKNDNEFEHSLKLFNVMKTKLESSKKVDNEFYSRVRTRLQKYMKQLQEIRQTLEDVLRRSNSLIEETKKASWT